MKSYDLPFCAGCPIAARMTLAPEIAATEPVQQVAGYVEDLNLSLMAFIHLSGVDRLRALFAPDEILEFVDLNTNPFQANHAIAKEVKDARQQILDYVDLLPADVSTSTLMAIGRCAHKLGAGDCYYSSSLPGLKEMLE